ncbi:MAG: nif-specific transcriptional activator NifA [Candidatus Omnitrophica bacterium CG11_big_fil_rev_8_21_14_0_20_45_26]|uniref:Nif-specific regulatory protein n=1 Tax=Candidatus Abzuiibacterium crystallinum TaxID=1974748 RepID=A0A2H0LSH4_9BACT|nr:MAG: nif-specific transcriptional activator NifA [Candidatus Omnitrophica bacterium CG11_big_fil_rev_8_21_14_0_20_45_26]PIW64167.1 MAG: nif-specific transcriptional activator NifA [Candidatus Omnitrophica bacterium CG12_big_fil_rev_8_21_14_0_65_45_16]
MKSNTRDASQLKRELQELSALNEISKAFSSSLDLEKMIGKVMDILHSHFGMERGTLTLLDPETNELVIEVAQGLDPEVEERVRYKIGEGITGKVVASGEPIVIRNIGDEPLFLNKTKARDLSKSNISFLCIPIRLGRQTIGALSVDKVFQEDISFEVDLHLLTIVGSMVAQAVQINQLVKEEKRSLSFENEQLRGQLKKKFRPKNIIAESKRMTDVFSSIDLVSQTKATVMLRGESGTGKELVAHAIHYQSDRADKPFVKVSCASLPETLLESELFGHMKGAFTGANASKAGRFEMANGGTLFLDEIGEINKSIQVKLLRVLQEKEFERVGGTETIRVDIRLLTATNRDLEKEVREGRFREDLYYRLNVIPIFIPALRDRREDIPLLVKYFIEKFNLENNKKIFHLSQEAWDHVMGYSWPGNVRELENAIERAVIMCQSDTILRDHFPIDLQARIKPFTLVTEESEENNNLKEAVETIEKRMISRVLEKIGGNKRKAAQMLGVTERILGYKVRKYGINSSK